MAQLATSPCPQIHGLGAEERVPLREVTRREMGAVQAGTDVQASHGRVEPPPSLNPRHLTNCPPRHGSHLLFSVSLSKGETLPTSIRELYSSPRI